MVKKAPQAFRTITEVSTWLDEPAHVLRFWESKFSQIKPVKRAGGRRYYRPEDMELLGGIKVLLHDQGQTIKSVQDMLKEQGVKHVQSFSPELDFPSNKRRKKSKKKAEAVVSDKAEEPVTQNEVAEDTREIRPEVALADHIARGKVSLDKQPTGQAASQTREDSSDRTETSKETRTSQEAVSDAREQISAAVGKQKADAHLGLSKINVTVKAGEVNIDDVTELEDLFYQLKRVRNRMKRSLEAL